MLHNGLLSLQGDVNSSSHTKTLDTRMQSTVILVLNILQVPVLKLELLLPCTINNLEITDKQCK